ncbi:hypothetical protein TWF730_010477 [Orbilia blumenaviensis]|uniref:Rhodopsin domain-containing protein n=1 Tax=Orbilia blumenaviensis TaxID=1796055 RepID=A0AAV9UPC0_9PEZI
MRAKYRYHHSLTLPLIVIIIFPILTSTVEIGFQTQTNIYDDLWHFQPAWPQGRSCYSIKPNPKDPITSIKIRTGRTEIQNKKTTPDAIGFFQGKKCSIETLRFVVFYYLPPPDNYAIDQRFNLDELPALFRGFDRYREIKDGTLEWFNLLSDALRDGNSLNEGDVVYQLTDRTWHTLPNVVEVTDIPTISNPFPEAYEWYLNTGLRQSTLRKGNYLGHFRGLPTTDFMRSRTADIERDETQQLLRSISRRERTQPTTDRYSAVETFKIVPSPIEMFSRTRISDVSGSPYFPGPSKKSLSPLIKTVTADDGNIDPEEAIEWDTKIEERASVPQMETMDRIMPYLPRNRPRIPSAEVDTGQEGGSEDIVPEDLYHGISHSQLQYEGYDPPTAGKTSRRNHPPRRNMYSSEYFAAPLKWPGLASYDTIQTLKEEEFEDTPMNRKMADFGQIAAVDDELNMLDQESWRRINNFAKYTGPSNVQRKTPIAKLALTAEEFHSHQNHMTPHQIHRLEIGSKLNIPSRFMLVGALWSLKFVILDFLWRIIRKLPYERPVMITYTLTIVVTWIAATAILLAECRPFRLWWQLYPDPGPCVQANKWLITYEVGNMVTDAMLLALPFPLLFMARVPWEKRIRLCALFSIGFFLIAICLVRMVQGLRQAHFQLSRTMWASIETLFATIVACAPTIYCHIRRCLRDELIEETPSIRTIRGYRPSTAGSSSSHAASAAAAVKQYRIGKKGGGGGGGERKRSRGSNKGSVSVAGSSASSFVSSSRTRHSSIFSIYRRRSSSGGGGGGESRRSSRNMSVVSKNGVIISRNFSVGSRKLSFGGSSRRSGGGGVSRSRRSSYEIPTRNDMSMTLECEVLGADLFGGRERAGVRASAWTHGSLMEEGKADRAGKEDEDKESFYVIDEEEGKDLDGTILDTTWSRVSEVDAEQPGAPPGTMQSPRDTIVEEKGLKFD